MKLTKFRIQSYKSIQDSGYCWLASDLTTLAGKNESGKTAVLEALRDFNTDVKTIPDQALPLSNNGQPVLEMCFQVDKATLDQIAAENDVTIDQSTRAHFKNNGITIKKFHDGSYELQNDVSALPNIQNHQPNLQHITTIKMILDQLESIDHFQSVQRPEISDSVESIRQAVTNYIEQLKPLTASIPEDDSEQDAASLIDRLTSEMSSLVIESEPPTLLDLILEYVPQFIFFSDFLDILPFEIPLSEAKNHNAVQNFANVAKLNLDEVIQTTDSQRRRNLLSEHSATISGDFMDYWGQHKLDLIAEPDGDNLRLGVRESGNTTLYKCEQRSKGFQWFLSFYLRLNSEQGKTKNILIDEPGLYLHAKAQYDVLKVLKQISTESQVIFSTHSPYLIDTGRLDRVRLVLKNDTNGTKIENKIHKGADVETLTPIITAIGLDVSNDFALAGNQNVLLEGISDYFFLQAFRKVIVTEVATLIPCVGAKKIPQIVSLLIGWGLEFVAVLDNDKEGMDVKKTLSDKLMIEHEKIIFVSEKNGHSMEDLFSHDDFNDFVVADVKNDDKSLLNSKFVKRKKLDKVLLAKKFLESVENNDGMKDKLSPETINAFEKLLTDISNGFTHP